MGQCTLYKLEYFLVLVFSLSVSDEINFVLKDNDVLKLHDFNGCQMFWGLGLRTGLVASWHVCEGGGMGQNWGELTNTVIKLLVISVLLRKSQRQTGEAYLDKNWKITQTNPTNLYFAADSLTKITLWPDKFQISLKNLFSSLKTVYILTY